MSAGGMFGGCPGENSGSLLRPLQAKNVVSHSAHSWACKRCCPRESHAYYWIIWIRIWKKKIWRENDLDSMKEKNKIPDEVRIERSNRRLFVFQSWSSAFLQNSSCCSVVELLKLKSFGTVDDCTTVWIYQMFHPFRPPGWGLNLLCSVKNRGQVGWKLNKMIDLEIFFCLSPNDVNFG